jgi:hypothetical protein
MITSTTSTLDVPSATPATPAGARVAPSIERAAPEPSAERRTTSTKPGPSRASSPPLPEILGRPPRIAAESHTNADDAWMGVLAGVTGALRSEVAKARAVDEARLNEGWALLH